MISAGIQTCHHFPRHVSRSGLCRPDPTTSPGLLPHTALGEHLLSESEAQTLPGFCQDFLFFFLLCQAIVGRMGLGIRPTVGFNPVMALLSM